MTNFDLHKKELKKLKHKFAVGLDGNVADCTASFCSKCIFNSENACDEARIDWLLQDYRKKANEEEKALVKYVGISQNVKYKYIARNENGSLYLYRETPSKENKRYILRNDSVCYEIHGSLFPWIRYSDGVYNIEKDIFINIK